MECPIDFGRLMKQFDETNRTSEKSLATMFPKRVIVDISTDTFIKVIFADDKNYYLFLNYVNFLDFYLNYYGNLDLVNNSFPPLGKDEAVETFFKGGNVMSYHFSRVIISPRIKELFAAYFKKSDFDFSVNILTNSDNRFNLIKKYFYNWILSFLKQTSHLFNHYLEKVLKAGPDYVSKQNNRLLDNFRSDEEEDKFSITYRIIKEFINLPQMEQTMKIIREYQRLYGEGEIPFIRSIDVNTNGYVNIRFDRAEIITKSDNFPSHDILAFNIVIDNYNNYIWRSFLESYQGFYQKSKYHAMILYPYLKYLVHPNSDHEYHYEQLIDDLIHYNFSLIKSNRFYTLEKLTMMTEMISQSLTALTDTYYEINSQNPPAYDELSDPAAFSRYRVINPQPQVKIAPRADFIVYNDFQSMLGTKVVELDKKDDINHVHYVSGNFTIRNVSRNGPITDFDLFRIKFNIVALDTIDKNGKLLEEFNIPSEFIDISITSILSSLYHEDEEIFVMPIEVEGFLLPNIPVRSHSYVYFINDLSRVLFRDAGFIPWTKGKYEKRIKRLLLLIYLYDIRHQTNYLSVIHQLANAIKFNLTHPKEAPICLDQFSLSPVFVASYLEYRDFYDLVYLDKKYQIINKLMKFLLIFTAILGTANPLEILNRFRESTFMLPLTDLSILRDQYLKFLDEIIDSTDAIFRAEEEK